MQNSHCLLGLVFSKNHYHSIVVKILQSFRSNHQCGDIFYHFSSSILPLLILNVMTIIVWRVGLMDLL